MKRIAVLIVALASFAAIAPSAANADITSALGISCTTKDNTTPAYEGQRWCGTGAYMQTPANNRSTVQSFDGVPIDVNVAFPKEATFGDGPYPLVMMFHGYGGGKIDFPGMQRWLNKGYAVFSQTNRGFHESCGTALSKAADVDCATKGFARLDDDRYEVRDAQLFAGMLANEGDILPTKIAATGGSYGGGMSMALAALKDRTMMPDGTLVPWTSPAPENTPMQIAVAVPEIPWTDLAYSLAPNGSNIDYVKDSSYFGRFGVMKQSYVDGLYLSGITSGEGYYTAPGVEPSADLTGWKAFMDAGEPYDGKAEATALLNEIHNFHSSYYIDHSEAPAPLMISSGFTDDLFPANEATRFYNRTRAQYPNTPLALFFGDFGHPRAANKTDVTAALAAQENTWVDHYLSGTGSQPPSNVTTYTQTCPDTSGTPSGGPYVKNDWVSESPGEIRIQSPGSQTIAPDSGTASVSAGWNPGQLTAPKPCVTEPGAKEPGTADYETAPAPAGGYTEMGSPTVVAKITQAGVNSQIAARIVDVSADGSTKTLINRGLWRPANSGYQVFQLNPNGWHVAEGHVLRLELLSHDASAAAAIQLSNYGRPSTDQQPATIENMDLRIPVVESPGALNGLVTAPAKRVMPDRPGVELAVGNESIGSESVIDYGKAVDPCPAGTHGTSPPDCTDDNCPSGQVGTPPNCTQAIVGAFALNNSPKVKGKTLKVSVICKIGFNSCSKTKISFKGAPKGKKGKGKGLLIASGSVPAGKSGAIKTITLKLTGKARKFFKDRKVRRHGKKKVVKGPKSLRAKVTVAGKSAGTTTVKRVGKVK